MDLYPKYLTIIIGSRQCLGCDPVLRAVLIKRFHMGSRRSHVSVTTGIQNLKVKLSFLLCDIGMKVSKNSS